MTTRPDNSEQKEMVGDGKSGSCFPASDDPKELDAPETYKFAKEFHALSGSCSLPNVVESLLKYPAALVFEIAHGRRGRVVAAILVAVCLCLAAFGLVMGSFTGGRQYWAVPAKVVIGTLLSALLCLPSLYIFSSLSGGRLNLQQTVGLLALFVGLISLLELGFAPIIWIFAQSTQGMIFMGFLHLGCWIVGWLFAFKLLAAACAYLNRQQIALLRVWGVLFLVVTLQMSTALRPLIAAPEHGLLENKKLFFTTHWGECFKK